MPLLLEAYINGSQFKRSTFDFRIAEGKLYINTDNIEKWGVKLPLIDPLDYEGLTYYPLDAFPDMTYEINQQNLSILFNIPPQLFNETKIDVSDTHFIKPTRSTAGAFLDYAFNAQTDNDDNSSVSGFWNTTLFTPYGTANTTFLASTGNPLLFWEDDTYNKFLRLSTNWRTDFPETMHSLILGDSFSEPGMWGCSVGFIGLQWQRNFSTQPKFRTIPLPSFRGEAVLPSAVELYIQNMLIKRADIAFPGPFTLESIPVVTGSGTIDIVTTDILGRQQTQ